MTLAAFLLLVAKAITVIEAIDDAATLLEGSAAALRAAQADGSGVVPVATVAALGLTEREELGANG